MIMIDWVTAKIPFFYPGVISDGEILSITRDGVVEYALRKRFTVRGSYDSSITIRTEEVDANGDTAFITLSGNPVKFLQGHNLFGSDDLNNLVSETVLRVSKLIDCQQPANVLQAVYSGFYTFSRIDINRMISLGTRASVEQYLYTLSMTSRTRSQGSVTKGSTVYLNKSSRRWSFKFYSKGQEVNLRRNRKQGTINLPRELLTWADPMLRAELTLKSNELRETGLHLAVNWNTMEVLDLFSEYAERIDMSPQKPMEDLLKSFEEIKPKSAISTYYLWKDGHDLKNILPKRTYYRHRRVLMDCGIDISMPPPPVEDKSSNVVPLCKVLEAKPAEIPHWVYGTEYLFEPRKLCSGESSD